MKHWIQNVSKVSRRDFLKGTAAGGFVVGLQMMPVAKTGPFSGFGGIGNAGAATGTLSPNVFVSIDRSGTVTIIAHRSEMGQGVRTSVPMILADELEADWSRVKIEQAVGDKMYGNQYTDGSRSVRHNLQRMREFGATTRAMLEQAGAVKWGVSSTECKAVNHKVTHIPTGRTADYGELVDIAATLTPPDAKRVTLKDPKEWRYIGKEMIGVDNQNMVVGTATFGIDVKLPGMKYAAIAHCPVTYGKVKSYDASEALKVPGVEKVVEIPQNQPPIVFNTLGGIAVIATNTWAANEGRKKLKIDWDLGPNRVYNSGPFRQVLENEARNAKDAKVVRKEGDADRALKGAAKTVEATFYVPHFAHATMEPPSAVAVVKDGKCEVWSPCQDPQAARATVAGAIGMDEENVTSRATLLGGGFGRKSKPDFAAEAAILSKMLGGGTPVKVIWSREDDIHHAYYHTVCAQHVKAGLDSNGKAVAYHHRTVFPTIWSSFVEEDPQYGHQIELSLGFLEVPYHIPNLTLENGKAKSHVRIGWLRSVNNIPHAFAQNSTANMMAYAAGRDPYEYLMELLGPDRILDMSNTDYWNYDQTYEEYPIMTARLKNVLRMAAEKSGYGKRLGNREAIGLAVHRSFTSYVASAVRVQVSGDGKLTIPQVDMVIDAGLVVNPDRVRSQMEGSVIYGLTGAMYGEITAKDGAIEQSNFHDYPMVRIPESPKVINTHIVDAANFPPGGVGEPGVPPFIPALTNAIFAATGKRILELPISKQNLSA
ncbi:MAG TPA: molybdopterin cofactor-binding domain-containing protein [Burkholderiales bacterium]|nr:molybdopterin cofactor-binding domain-containing protein [Burkholderiales bacterium]